VLVLFGTPVSEIPVRGFSTKGIKIARSKTIVIILFQELDVYREAIKRYHDANTRNYTEDAEDVAEPTGNSGDAVWTPHLQIG
jgi:hypothetical protein